MTDRITAATMIAMLLFLFLQGCARPAGEQPPESAGDEATWSVTLMTFNVENLFDAEDDPGKDDKIYLPIEAKQSESHRAACAAIDNDYWREQCLEWDWDEEVVAKKLSVVAEAILQVGDGIGPDILVLQEVENLRILERLRRDYLQAADYQPGVLLEGADNRGIDVAFLSRYELVGQPKLHPIPFHGFPPSRIDDTRPILEATFRLPGGSLLTGYAVHFPAPYHPYEMRIQAYRFLEELRASLPPGRLAFAAGDFNTPALEDRQQKMLDRYVRPGWIVGHEAGCEDCPGTHYYRRGESWSFLDTILWARVDGEPAWELTPGSARLANRTPAQMTPEGYPRRFRMPEASGVSDHWPLVVEIQPRQ